MPTIVYTRYSLPEKELLSELDFTAFRDMPADRFEVFKRSRIKRLDKQFWDSHIPIVVITAASLGVALIFYAISAIVYDSTPRHSSRSPLVAVLPLLGTAGFFSAVLAGMSALSSALSFLKFRFGLRRRLDESRNSCAGVLSYPEYCARFEMIDGWKALRPSRNEKFADEGDKSMPLLPRGARAGDTHTLPNGMEMIWCPPGTFNMGEGGGNQGKCLVVISKGFWIGKYPVTQGEWQAVMNSNCSFFKASGPRAPMESVSWYDVQDFLAAVGNGFRLPTEAEWEYACRAGSNGIFCFGDDHSDLSKYAWYGSKSTRPVGQKLPNAWGIHDMHGNVDEWCGDWFGGLSDWFGKRSVVTDPSGPSAAVKRVARGGSWLLPWVACTSTFRGKFLPDSSFSDLGFRVVADCRPSSMNDATIGAVQLNEQIIHGRS